MDVLRDTYNDDRTKEIQKNTLSKKPFQINHHNLMSKSHNMTKWKILAMNIKGSPTGLKDKQVSKFNLKAYQFERN